VVEAVGADVTYVKPVITSLRVCRCSAASVRNASPPHQSVREHEVKLLPGMARRLKLHGKVLNQAFNLSAFAERMLVHEHAIVKIREDIPLDRAALVAVA